MLDTGLPSSQVAEIWCQLAGTVSASEKPLPGTTLAKVRVLESVALASSSSWKLAGLRPPPAVKSKSWASSGTAFLTTVSWAALAVGEGARDDLARGAR